MVLILLRSCTINLLFEKLPFILLNYSEQITAHTIIDFNFIAFFGLQTIYNKINNNDAIRVMNGFVVAY